LIELEGPKLNSKFHFQALFAVLKLYSKFKSQSQSQFTFLKLYSKLNLKANSQARFISPGFASQSPVHITVNFLLGLELQAMIQALESSFDLMSLEIKLQIELQAFKSDLEVEL